MALGEDVPDVDEFDRDDLRLSPEMHLAQAEMAAERGEEYDPYEFERDVRERVEQMPGPFEEFDGSEE